MKEHPILFSGPMVKAILEGKKTVTRRVIKEIRNGWRDGTIIENEDRDYFTCPYGRPGDRLWVRETWAAHLCHDDTKPRDIPYRIYMKNPSEHPHGASVYYAVLDNSWDWEDRGKIRPSIFMPRWASRINLEIISIGVERLQEITEDEAEKEGLCFDEQNQITAREHFENLWNKINGKKHLWESNPYVWRIEFERVPK